MLKIQTLVRSGVELPKLTVLDVPADIAARLISKKVARSMEAAPPEAAAMKRARPRGTKRADDT